MEHDKIEGRDVRRRTRPAQRLYVPPAQRNKSKGSRINSETNSTVSEADVVESEMNSNSRNDEQSLVITLDQLKIDDDDQQEMERAIVNINRKTRPLIKHVNVGNKDVLHIAIEPKSKVKAAILDEQVSNWEDLCNDDDEFNRGNTTKLGDIRINGNEEDGSSDDEEFPKKNRKPHDLDHVIELYDFPSTFRTQDLMQLYSNVNNESMYVKWCDETHALLVLSTPNQAKKALHIQHDIIKSRSMSNASNVAMDVASRVDLKPAMKRPQTNMQTARRLINSHLGRKSKLSQEENAREREELRKAKELKKALKQSENDAWDGHPRPSTA